MTNSTKKIKRFSEIHGLKINIKEIPESTKTSADAAKAIGCKISDIAKSIVFKSKSGKPILVIAEGSKRVNERAIECEVGEEVYKADANFVKEETGFAIGGIPPFGHKSEILTFIDKNLMSHDVVWAAAGTPNSVFSIPPEELVRTSKGKIIEVS